MYHVKTSEIIIGREDLHIVIIIRIMMIYFIYHIIIKTNKLNNY
jgi:hypothetical protein